MSNVAKTSVLFLTFYCDIISEHGFILTTSFFYVSLYLIMRGMVQRPPFLAMWEWIAHSYRHYVQSSMIILYLCLNI